jgi:hypothetical protein
MTTEKIQGWYQEWLKLPLQERVSEFAFVEYCFEQQREEFEAKYSKADFNSKIQFAPAPESKFEEQRRQLWIDVCVTYNSGKADIALEAFDKKFQK